MKRAMVIGVGMTDVVERSDEKPFDMALESIGQALLDAGVGTSEIDGIATTQIGYMVDQGKFLVQRMAEYLQVTSRCMFELDCGGASSLIALRRLAAEIELGRVNCGLVYASHWEMNTRMLKEQHADVKHLVRMSNSMYGSYDSRYGVLSPMAYYAMCIQRYMYECKVRPEQIAALPVVLRQNAAANPRAMYREPVSTEDVLESRMLAPPIHLLESCPISHGAAAAVVASEEVARGACNRPILLKGYGESHDASSFLPSTGDISRFPSVKESADEAYADAGISAADIDLGEVYGAFAGTELMSYEELGFFDRGEAPFAVEEGRTRIGGDTPLNTSGGRLSLGHAAYATPLFEVYEVVKQLRGEAGPRQVDGASLGLVQAEHGLVNGSAVYVMEAV